MLLKHAASTKTTGELKNKDKNGIESTPRPPQAPP